MPISMYNKIAVTYVRLVYACIILWLGKNDNIVWVIFVIIFHGNIALFIYAIRIIVYT